MIAATGFATTDPAVAQPAAMPLPEHHARYEVLRRGAKVGEVDIELSRSDDGIWLYDTKTRATALRARMLGLAAEESAHFVWHNGHVLPLTYRQVSRGPGRSRYWQHRLNWEAGISEAITHEGPLEVGLEPSLLDPLTLRLQMAVHLADPALRETDQEFRVLERNEVEDQQFLFQGRERLELDAICFETVRMLRFRKEGSSRNYHSWHAAEFHWMPVRIVQLKDGREELDIRLIETSINIPEDACSDDVSSGDRRQP